MPLGPTRLRPVLQRYAWGSLDQLQRFLGLDTDGQPLAELWFGAHRGGCAIADTASGPCPLVALIAADPVSMLGRESVDRFGPTLPFLFKVVAAASPLSVQCHPDEEQARIGFARENQRGIALDAPARIYRDENPKPELLIALGPFHALCGLRPQAEVLRLFEAYGLDMFERDLAHLRTTADLSRLVTSVLTSASASRRALQVARAVPVETTLPAYALVRQLIERFPDDPAALAPLLLNEVSLAYEDGLFLAPRQLHAYVSGFALEVMASSDNVVRAGLTQKHVDVDELLRIVSFEPTPVGISRPAVDGAQRTYVTPFDHFAVSLFALDGTPVGVTCTNAKIVVCYEGACELVDEGGRHLSLARGEAAFVPASSASMCLSGAGAAAVVGIRPS